MEEVFSKQTFYYLQFHLVLQVEQKLHTAIYFKFSVEKVSGACPCISCYHNAILGHAKVF